MNNIILEKRQDILSNNNNAQSQLEYILERLHNNTTIDRFEFNEPFQGNLDFSILLKHGFNNIKTIIFGKGEITSIANLPDNLEVLKINDQYLTELNDLPKGLIHLECCNNYLTGMESFPPNLKILNISNNKLETLTNLPNTLEELYCDNNNISRLILRDIIGLEVLHCSNNKTIIIDGIPPSVKDFKSENNPFIEQNNIIDIHGSNSVRSSKTLDTESARIDYFEALKEYFKLKSKYESDYKNARINAYYNAKKRGIGKRGRANEVAKVLPKCASCNRPVGSIFTITSNKFYVATCGDVQNPCKLNIKLNRGYVSNSRDNIIIENSIEDVKNLVINAKLLSIFKYTDEESSLAKFKKLMDDYNELYSYQVNSKNVFDKLTYDPEREQLIKRKTEQIYKLVSAIKLLITEYEQEGNPNILKTAVELQVNELNPEIENLRKLKYEVMEMNNDVLIQMYSSVHKLTYYNDEPKVIKWSV
jgi:hypothetical protein